MSDSQGHLSIVPLERWGALPHEFRILCIKEAILIPPSPAASSTPWSSEPVSSIDLDLSFAIAAWRWFDFMEDLLLAPKAAIFLQELCARTRQGAQVTNADALADMRPQLGELMRDGGAGLLSLPALRSSYAKLSSALCRVCCSRLTLPKPSQESSLGACLRRFCLDRREKLSEIHRELATAEKSRVELLCNQAIRLDLFEAYPFLRRASARTNKRALDDLKVYLILSARSGFTAANHASAYFQLAEGYLEELELRTATQGALLEDRTFHSLVDQAEISLNLAIRYDGGRSDLGHAAATQHLLQRLETLRSARRTAAEFLDAPLIASNGEATDVAPWPLDLTAGIPDLALFSRRPNIGSSQSQRPVDLLFLASQTVLDVVATLSQLAVRATAFATRFPECLHWKYRPKPIHLHLHASTVDRLAQSLLCFMIMKQLGEKADEASGRRHRWLCCLLTAVLFCRTLTLPQRKEVDRLLKLLILAANDAGSFSRTFPWLELDDDRKSTLPMGKVGVERSEVVEEGHDWSRGVQEQLEEIQGVEHEVRGDEQSSESSYLLFHLQQVWIGWLSSGPQETPGHGHVTRQASVSPTEDGALSRASRRSTEVAFQEPLEEVRPLGDQQLDVAEVHRCARRSILGLRVTATYEAMDSTLRHAEELSQRRWWALEGHLPVYEDPDRVEEVPMSEERAASRRSMSGSRSSQGFDGVWAKDQEPGASAPTSDLEEQPEHLRPPDPRAVWYEHLDEVRREEEWRLNPCVLEHVSWQYDPEALSDPFLTFSWYLQKTSGWDGDWHQCPAAQGKPFDEPLDSRKPPVLEMIWEHLYHQLKHIGSIFHALEARDNSWAMDVRRSLVEEMAHGRGSKSNRRKQTRAKYRTAAGKSSQISTYLHVKVSEELRRRVAQEEEEHTIELAKTDVVGELEELKRRRRDLSLELEMRDYVTLASMKEKEADWWGQAARNAAAYDAETQSMAATWKAAPEDCAPLRLRIYGYAGRVWHVLKACCFRGCSFDVIDAPKLLCEGVGILGMSTWFDVLLKPVPHSYIQTRHCEDFFERRLSKHMADERVPLSARSAVQARFGALVAARTPLDTARSSSRLVAPLKPRAVFTANGLAKRPGEMKPASPRPTELNLSIERRLQPELTPFRNRPPRQVKVSSKPKAPFPSYTAESKFFEYLARESLATKSNAVQLQLLLGMSFRCEPLHSDLGLIYLGACNLWPARRDFLPWDSILATGCADWPGDFSQFSEELLGGTKSVPLHESRAIESAAGHSLCVSDVAALITRHSELPSDESKARALGCRLLRLRKLCGGHPPLSWDAEERRCSNAAFCTRRLGPIDQPGQESHVCSSCKCAYYCSKFCQSTHFVAHQFECKTLRQLRQGAENLRGPQLRLNLVEVLEELLAKQVSYVSQIEATTLCHSVQEALSGAQIKPEVVDSGPVSLPALPTHALHRGSSGFVDLKSAMGDTSRPTTSNTVPGTSFVLLPEDQFEWKVSRPKEDPGPQESEWEKLKTRSHSMFGALSSNVHMAVGVVRLMSRWANTSNSVHALKEVTENGLFFCLITGLCLTKSFAERELSPETIVAVLSHRMALHVAASQDSSLAAIMRPPSEFKDLGMSALDSAQYSAYYGFLNHRRLPFEQLRPFLPVVAFVLGDRARDALLALPQLLDPKSTRSRRSGRLGGLRDVAREYEIHLVDSVELDPLTGRCWFLLYNSLLANPRNQKEGWILLLDASRGLQAVSCPLRISELRRCAL